MQKINENCPLSHSTPRVPATELADSRKLLWPHSVQVSVRSVSVNTEAVMQWEFAHCRTYIVRSRTRHYPWALLCTLSVLQCVVTNTSVNTIQTSTFNILEYLTLERRWCLDPNYCPGQEGLKFVIPLNVKVPRGLLHQINSVLINTNIKGTFRYICPTDAQCLLRIICC
jgi:invasion protein IalB